MTGFLPHAARSLRTGGPLAVLAFLAACGGSGSTEPPPPPPPASVAAVTVSPTSAEVTIGGSVTLSATPRDGAGNPLVGRPVTWNSSVPAVASVSAAGVVTGLAAGATVITATSEGRSGAASITVLPAPVASVVVTPSASTISATGTQVLEVTLLDAASNPLTGRAVTWSTSNEAVATVSSAGLVTAAGPGLATITATSEGVSGTAMIGVLPPDGTPVITGIAPNPMVPGATATITGVGFATESGQVTVSVQGVVTPAATATAFTVTFTVPCVSSGLQSVRVTSIGLTGAAFPHPVEPPVRTVGLGQALILSAGGGVVACNELVLGGAGERYVVMPYSVATAPNSVLDFELQGDPPAPWQVPVTVAAAPERLPSAPTQEEALLAEYDRNHLIRLEENRRILEEGLALGQRGLAESRHAPTTAPQVNDTRTLNFRFSGGCAAPTEFVNGRVVYSGTRAVIWEDQNNTVLSQNVPAYAAALQRIGTLFDAEQYDVIKNHFADPLRRDLDGDGRVHMVFTHLVPSGTAAFVTSCDQFSPATSPSSNFGEFFYSQVPANAGSNPGNTTFVDGWLYFVMRTVIHEVKHIASHAARVSNGAPVFESSWLEEGTARHAEELWARNHIHLVPWKGNAGWGSSATNGVYCDFHLTDATCSAGDPAHRPNWGMRRHFHEIRNKLLQPWNWSPFGDATGQSGSVFYQVSWSLVRYAIDRHGLSDAAFLGALTESSTNGVTNLTERAGVSLAELLGGWGLALYADDYPGLAAPHPALQFPTWNLRSIYAGLNASSSWVGLYPTPFILATVPLPAGVFTTTRTGLRGGAHSYYEIVSTGAGRQLLRLGAVGGGAASPDLRLAIARVQ